MKIRMNKNGDENMNSWKKYTFGFDLGGLILFMIIMIPNLI